ncbi:unnamed protein product [Polarella glacialis]|uniref:3'-5' exonuclease domain-containing protein n=1 Tax=Polarella glacialis TaxID=89957 RepID=A0A813E4I6_POLGL|nr:unnamed protein product [Polarella glacialis]
MTDCCPHLQNSFQIGSADGQVTQLSGLLGYWRDSLGNAISVQEATRGMQATFVKPGGSRKGRRFMLKEPEPGEYHCGSYVLDKSRSVAARIVWRSNSPADNMSVWIRDCVVVPAVFDDQSSTPAAPEKSLIDEIYNNLQSDHHTFQTVCMVCGQVFFSDPKRNRSTSASNFEPLFNHRHAAHNLDSITDLRLKANFAMRMMQESSRKHKPVATTVSEDLLHTLFDHFHEDPFLLLLCCSMLLETGQLFNARHLYMSQARALLPLLPILPGISLLASAPMNDAWQCRLVDGQCDVFGPLGPGCINLPRSCTVRWVDSEAMLETVTEELRTVDVVGVDCEYSGFGELSRVSLLQIATHMHCFLVDLDALHAARGLREFVGTLFEGETVKLAFQFDADLAQLRKSGMDYNVQNLIDLQRYWPDRRTAQHGLRGIVHEALDTMLCKAEQCSRWERRPLRASQKHYAAVDAWVLLPCCDHLCTRLNCESVLELMDWCQQSGASNEGPISRARPPIPDQDSIQGVDHSTRSKIYAEAYLRKIYAEAEETLGGELLITVESAGSLVKARALLPGSTTALDDCWVGKSETTAKICCLRALLKMDHHKSKRSAKRTSASGSQLPQHLRRYLRQGHAEDIPSFNV